MSNVATIISIAPCSFVEEKASLIPKTYIIPKCDTPDNPVLYKVNDAVTFEYIDEVRKNRRYPVSAQQVAASIVNDIKNAMFGRDSANNAFPGITYVPDEINSLSELTKKYPNLLGTLREQQTNWYKFLVHLADDDWSKFRQHKMITALSVQAAKYLGLEREWIIDFTATQKKCPGCMSFVHNEAIICKHCNTVLNLEKFKLLQRANA
jgi:hypothetical protein